MTPLSDLVKEYLERINPKREKKQEEDNDEEAKEGAGGADKSATTEPVSASQVAVQPELPLQAPVQNADEQSVGPSKELEESRRRL